MKKSLALISLAAFAAFAPAQATHLLRVNTKPGQTFKYVLLMRSSLVAVQSNLSMKTVKAQNKLFTFETRFGTTTINNQPAPSSERLKSIVITTVMDSLGNVTKSEVKGMAQGEVPTQSTVSFPVQALKLGQTWTAEGVVNGQKVKTTYKLVEVKPVSGMKAAVIHATPSSMAQVKTIGPIVFTVELATGMPISMKMNGEARQSDGSKMNIEITMNRGLK